MAWNALNYDCTERILMFIPRHVEGKLAFVCRQWYEILRKKRMDRRECGWRTPVDINSLNEHELLWMLNTGIIRNGMLGLSDASMFFEKVVQRALITQNRPCLLYVRNVWDQHAQICKYTEWIVRYHMSMSSILFYMAVARNDLSLFTWAIDNRFQITQYVLQHAAHSKRIEFFRHLHTCYPVIWHHFRTLDGSENVINEAVAQNSVDVVQYLLQNKYRPADVACVIASTLPDTRVLKLLVQYGAKMSPLILEISITSSKARRYYNLSGADKKTSSNLRTDAWKVNFRFDSGPEFPGTHIGVNEFPFSYPLRGFAQRCYNSLICFEGAPIRRYSYFGERTEETKGETKGETIFQKLGKLRDPIVPHAANYRRKSQFVPQRYLFHK